MAITLIKTKNWEALAKGTITTTGSSQNYYITTTTNQDVTSENGTVFTSGTIFTEKTTLYSTSYYSETYMYQMLCIPQITYSAADFNSFRTSGSANIVPFPAYIGNNNVDENSYNLPTVYFSNKISPSYTSTNGNKGIIRKFTFTNVSAEQINIDSMGIFKCFNSSGSAIDPIMIGIIRFDSEITLEPSDSFGISINI